MSGTEGVTPFLAPLAAVQRVIAHFHNQGLIIGGVAVSLLGIPRLTADVDVVLMLSVDYLDELMMVTRQEGLVPRITDADQFARLNRVLLLQHEASGIHVDIALGMLPFEQEAVERGTVYRVGTIELRLPTPEDLIILKAVAHRPKDLLDIAGIVQTHPRLDRQRIETWIRAFADALEMPSIWDDVEPILNG